MRQVANFELATTPADAGRVSAVIDKRIRNEFIGLWFDHESLAFGAPARAFSKRVIMATLSSPKVRWRESRIAPEFVSAQSPSFASRRISLSWPHSAMASNSSRVCWSTYAGSFSCLEFRAIPFAMPNCDGNGSVTYCYFQYLFE
jgi:hypothetical protein